MTHCICSININMHDCRLGEGRHSCRDLEVFITFAEILLAQIWEGF